MRVALYVNEELRISSIVFPQSAIFLYNRSRQEHADMQERIT